MIRGQRFSLFSAMLLLAAALGSAPGCTLFDEALPGTPFTPDQPVAEVTVVGEINIDPGSGVKAGCSAGKALLWGIARNTGDLDVDDVFIEIDTLDGNKNVIATYRVHVYNGEVSEVTLPEPPPGTPPSTEVPIPIAGTSLAVDQSGTFAVCTRQTVGSIAGTAYRTDFIVLNEITTQ